MLWLYRHVSIKCMIINVMFFEKYFYRVSDRRPSILASTKTLVKIMEFAYQRITDRHATARTLTSLVYTVRKVKHFWIFWMFEFSDKTIAFCLHDLFDNEWWYNSWLMCNHVLYGITFFVVTFLVPEVPKTQFCFDDGKTFSWNLYQMAWQRNTMSCELQKP